MRIKYTLTADELKDAVAEWLNARGELLPNDLELWFENDSMGCPNGVSVAGEKP